MRLTRFLLPVFFLLPSPLLGQRSCGAVAHDQQQALSWPGYLANRAAIEAHTQAVSNNPTGRLSSTQVLTVPVVVHIVYRTPQENLSDADVHAQMQVLNEDFRRLNADAVNTPALFQPVAADTHLEFCLASLDPNGQATTGITRTATTVTSFDSILDDVKFSAQGGKDAWPASAYLNIWVCNLGPGLLGYAQFPGGNPATDGVVIHHENFGNPSSAGPPFDRGRTLTHEVGHYLNLIHVWGDGGCGVDDLVADTPPMDGPSTGCPTGAMSCGFVRMPENYMDYSDDTCMNLFTQGQTTRMRALFDPGGARESLLTSNACLPALYQTNQSYSSLALNGVIGGARALAQTQVCVNESYTLDLGGRLPNLLWDVGLVLAPVLPGGIATPGGQIFNLNLADPSFFFLSGSSVPAYLAFPGTTTLPGGGAPVAATVSAQQIILDPSAPEIFAFSQPCELVVNQGGALPIHPAGPTGDDDVVSVNLAGSGTACGGSPIVFFGTSHDVMHVASNGRVTFGAADGSPLASRLAAATGPAMAGCWSDLDPSQTGSVTITATPAGGVRVDYSNLLYAGTIGGANSFGIEFDPTTGEVRLDGLGGLNPNLSGINRGQVLGLSPGTPSAILGPAYTFSPGASGASVVPGVVLLDESPTGQLPSLGAGTTQVTFLPLPAGGYSWMAL